MTATILPRFLFVKTTFFDKRVYHATKKIVVYYVILSNVFIKWKLSFGSAQLHNLFNVSASYKILPRICHEISVFKAKIQGGYILLYQQDNRHLKGRKLV